MSSPPHRSRRHFVLSLTETLTIAAIGGAAFGLTGFPAGWLSGSMLFVAIAALGGRPAHVPPPLAKVIFVVIGMSLGAVATPETLRGIWTWPISILVLLASVVAVTAATATYLQRFHQWDRMSAFLASAPGALSQVIIMSTQYKSDMRGIAIVQSMRVVILAVAVPAIITFMGLAAPAPLAPSVAVDNPLLEYGALIGISVAAGYILEWMNFRAGLMFGAMAASALLHGTGLVHAAIPWWVAAAAMCGLGAITGSRFANTPLSLFVSHLAAALGSFVVGIVVSGLFAAGLIALSAFRAADVIVSFAPGALDVMMILSLALHLDPIYVGAHHLARFIMISLALPVAARAVDGRR